MVQVTIDIANDLDTAMELISPANIERGLFFMLDAQALPDMTNYVPLDGGELRMSGHREDSSLVWDTPYAGAQYSGTAGKPPGVWHSDRQRKWFFANFFDDAGNYMPPDTGYTTPGTGPAWDEVAFASHGQDWMNSFLVGARLL